MFGEEGKLTNEELEFISENTEIDILPKITLGAIRFITVSFPYCDIFVIVPENHVSHHFLLCVCCCMFRRLF